MRILLAIDGSPHSEAAVREVGSRPWPPTTEVRIVTVDAPLGVSRHIIGGNPAYDELVRRQRVEATACLEKAHALIAQLAPQLQTSVLLLEGTAKEEINAEAGRWGADLVVVGSHGHGVARSLFLGSVSLAVVLGAPCSVLVVRREPQVS